MIPSQILHFEALCSITISNEHARADSLAGTSVTEQPSGVHKYS